MVSAIVAGSAVFIWGHLLKRAHRILVHMMDLDGLSCCLLSWSQPTLTRWIKETVIYTPLHTSPDEAVVLTSTAAIMHDELAGAHREGMHVGHGQVPHGRSAWHAAYGYDTAVLPLASTTGSPTRLLILLAGMRVPAQELAEALRRKLMSTD